MIDFLFLARSAVWITGAAIVVAAWSRGRVHGRGAGWRVTSATGAALFCFGFATIRPGWPALPWIALGAIAAARGWRERTFRWTEHP